MLHQIILTQRKHITVLLETTRQQYYLLRSSKKVQVTNYNQPDMVVRSWH